MAIFKPKTSTTPNSIEILTFFDSINGSLTCQKCGGFICNGLEFGTNKGNSLQYICHAIARHVCTVKSDEKNYDFPFDFASPLSIDEQLELWKQSQQSNPHTEISPKKTTPLDLIQVESIELLPDSIHPPHLEHTPTDTGALQPITDTQYKRTRKTIWDE